MSLQVIAGTHLKRDTPCANMVRDIIKKLTSEIYFNGVSFFIMLSLFKIKKWWIQTDSNRRPGDYESPALTD